MNANIKTRTNIDLASVAEPSVAELSAAVTIVGDVRLAMRSEQTRADIANLLDTAKAITAITNADGRQQAHTLLMLFVKARTAIDGRYEEVSASVRSFLDDARSERGDLKQLFADQEARIRKLRDDYDAEQARIKREKAEAEQRRKEAIEARIEEIRNLASEAVGKSAAEIAAVIERATAIAIDDTFAEFKSKAESVQKMTLDKLRYFHQAALDSEEKARELEQQRADLARQKAAEEIRQAQEREHLAEERRAAQKAAAAEAARQAEVWRRQQAEQEAENARVRAEQEAAAQAERERLAEEASQLEVRRQEQEALEQRQREEREAEESRIAEARQALEREQAALKDEQAVQAPVVVESVSKPESPSIVTASNSEFAWTKTARPSDEAILEILVRALSVDRNTVIEWLCEMDMSKLVRSAA